MGVRHACTTILLYFAIGESTAVKNFISAPQRATFFVSGQPYVWRGRGRWGGGCWGQPEAYHVAMGWPERCVDKYGFAGASWQPHTLPGNEEQNRADKTVELVHLQVHTANPRREDGQGSEIFILAQLPISSLSWLHSFSAAYEADDGVSRIRNSLL